ncbi:hypothetical protein GX50_01160 [[Emmonsia] crescens]|uniref:Uncharacterized protein n=1 Tax=[Emmonsia] crescens TaxID=73230 RepID=A0A2B7ZRQ5_9EURO|nr:hypothetical protein GX50_01160 [Emmonsia crescens]
MEDSFTEAALDDTFGTPPRDELLELIGDINMDGVWETGHSWLDEVVLEGVLPKPTDIVDPNLFDKSLANLSFNPPLTAEERYHQSCCDTLYKEHFDFSADLIDLTLTDDMNEAGTELPTPQSSLQETPPSNTPPQPLLDSVSPIRRPCRPRTPPHTPPEKSGRQRNSSPRNSPRRSQQDESRRENPQLGPQPNEGRIIKKYKNPLTASLKQFTKEILQESPNTFKNEWHKMQEATPTKRMNYVKLLEEESKNYKQSC